MHTQFTPLMSLTGGILIGLSAVLLMWLNGRIAGMTGILSGLLAPPNPDWHWRAAFTLGAVTSPLIWIAIGNTIDFAVPAATPALIVGGLIVGIGVTFGGGCTSGHGVCGIARLSKRSITATITFMAVTFITVYIIRHIWGQA
jgi:uncharacterized protein